LFQDVLHRAVDPAGRAFFDSALARGVTRQQLAASIFGSTEYVQNLVQGDYLMFLHRPADSGSLNSFAGALQQGARDQDVLAALLSSDERYSQIVGPAPSWRGPALNVVDHGLVGDNLTDNTAALQ